MVHGEIREEGGGAQFSGRLEALAGKGYGFIQKARSERRRRDQQRTVVVRPWSAQWYPFSQTGLPCSVKLGPCPSSVLPFSPSVARAGEMGVL